MIRSRQPDAVVSARCRHSKAVLWLTPHRSAAHSTGTLWRMSLMKETQARSGFLQCSRTVPVRELNLLPQQRQRHLGTPAAVDLFLQAPSAPHSGHPGSGQYAAAATASVPTPTSLRQCLSPTASLNSRNSSAVRPATSALKGFALSIWIFPIRPSAHPEGLSPNKDPGGRSGGFFVWLGRA